MDTKIIGGKIAAARKKINCSQAQLAEQLFISPQAVGKWERGESVPDIITMSRLAEILRVDLNYFSETFSSGPTEAETAAWEDRDPVPAETDRDQASPVSRHKKRSWDMSRANWVDADFSGLSNLHEKFSASNMQRCRFIGSDLSGLLLKGNHIVHCDFSEADLSGSHFQSSHLANDQFNNCSLKEAGFSGCHIQGSDFSGADFTGTTFKLSSCQKNILTNARFNQTSFIGSDISDIVFNGRLEDCYFENCAFSRVTFRDATLVNTFFKGRSLKKIRFADCQADRLTYEFLKNGKADLKGVTLLPDQH